MTADLSRARRRWAVGMLRRRRVTIGSMPRSTRQAYALLLLLADDSLTIAHPALVDAARDPSLVQAADQLLAKAGMAPEALAA